MARLTSRSRKGPFGKRKNSRRGTANSRFLRARSRAVRSPGPYRPRRLPRPAGNRSLRGFIFAVFLLVLAFGLAQIWKAHEIARLAAKLDNLRNRQQELGAELLTLQLEFKEISSYSRIETLAREALGMHSSPRPPVVIALIDEHVIASRRQDRDHDKREEK